MGISAGLRSRAVARMSAGLALLSVLLAAPPAKAQQAVQLNEIVGIFSEDGQFRLDIGTDAVKQNVPASHDSWATRLIIRRLDGPSRGPVHGGDLIGIFSEDGRFRLDIGTDAVKRNIPASHESWATRLRIVRLSGPNAGPVTYEDVVGIFSDDGRFRLDIGTDAMKRNVPADHDSWATRLRIRPR
jgi:hypothetical protein